MITLLLSVHYSFDFIQLIDSLDFIVNIDFLDWIHSI